MDPYAVANLFPGTYPGKPNLFAGSYPGSANLSGPYPKTSHEATNERGIVYHYPLTPWPDGSHLALHRGDLCFISRSTPMPLSTNDLELTPLQTVVDLLKLNSILKTGYRQSLERWRSTLNDAKLPVEAITKAPPETLLFMSEEHKKLPSTLSFSQEIEDIKKRHSFLLQDLSTDDSVYLEQEQRRIEIQEEQDTAIFNYFNEKKTLTDDGFVYLTKGSIMHFWNFIGVLNNTGDYSRWEFGESAQTAVPLANVVVQKTAQVANRWSDELQEGTYLYLILRRRKANDGTYHEFQVVPYWSATQKRPPLTEIQYLDLAGNLEVGIVWFVGTVHHRLNTTRAMSKRVISWGIEDTTEREAYNAKGALELIDIQVRM